jgi:LacI family transcriptional regulator
MIARPSSREFVQADLRIDPDVATLRRVIDFSDRQNGAVERIAISGVAMTVRVASRGEKTVTMVGVAKHAGVSVATVSRVIAGHPSVAPGHRARVEAAVLELGYRPNRLARNLRKRQSDMIGVVVSDIENPHFAEMIHVAESEAYRFGYRVLLCNTDESREKQASYLQMLADERPRGVLLAPCDPAGAEIGQLLDLGITVVAFDRPVLDSRVDSVLADNAAASRLAVDHLIQTGHQRISFVGTSPAVETGAARLAGYRAAMGDAGLEGRWENGGFRIETGQVATGRLLDRWPDSDAIVAGNNMMAVGAIRALRERGITIPDGIGLVSFDDPFWAELVDPPLTTLAQPLRAMVAAAVRLLIDGIEGRRRQPQRLVFGLELAIRASSGPLAVGRHAAIKASGGDT